MQSVIAKTSAIQPQIVDLIERKEREYEKKIKLTTMGMESYKSRNLDLDGNILQQVKDLIEDRQE